MWTARRLQVFLFFLACAIFPGCADPLPPPEEPEPQPLKAGADFDPTATGTLQGRVVWKGAVPVVVPYQSSIVGGDGVMRDRSVRANPNVPVVAADGGVGNAVICLRGLDPRQGRPWDQPAVTVEQREHSLHIRQGAADSQVGFVRRGDEVTMVSRQPILHALRAGGAAFFTLMFPEPDQPLSRRLVENGLVELSSGAGFYWMRANLFVDDHPYYTRTDAEGNFTLPQVPVDHRYEVVCWMPNWHETRRERDPENGQIARIVFGPPLEITQSVTLQRGETRAVTFTVTADLFRR